MKNKDFYTQMKLQEQEKRSAGSESTADLYRAVRNHFQHFNKERELSLGDITPERIYGFVEWLREKGLRVNSVNSYLSNLRAMYNRACLGWKKRPLDSPFARLRLRREETLKRAIPIEVIGQIAKLDLADDPSKQQAADLALFSFMACGMPFVDLVRLTRENLSEDGKVLSYHRQKTGTLIQMGVSQGMQQLIACYSQPDATYLFPLLPDNATHEQYKLCLAKQNQYLEEIRLMLEWDGKLTTYVFRHTWASEAYHNNVAIGIICQLLGHSSEQMTRTYLSAFDKEKVKEANQLVSGKIEQFLRF
ncbi:site-specific integrase [uncultured Parabacteroides sp.]|jgi:integrase|uniref:tyrosine-type recombinase/integrase n=1 Tax=uncultured Parabacteroides sp. TaxID=512312 RepID=UPI0025F0F086|nr:site-specific integrase [uncultured Parabacteroides sp.]